MALALAAAEAYNGWRGRCGGSRRRTSLEGERQRRVADAEAEGGGGRGCKGQQWEGGSLEAKSGWGG